MDKKTKTREEKNKQLVVDEIAANPSRFTFDALRDYVENAFKKYLNTTEAGTEEERRKEQQRKESLRHSIAS